LLTLTIYYVDRLIVPLTIPGGGAGDTYTRSFK